MSFHFLEYRAILALALCVSCLVHDTFAYKTQKYCCRIAKCRKIVDACQQEDFRINGTTCAESCKTDLTCAPLDGLTTKDYSCFVPFLNNTAGSPLGYVCGQAFKDQTQAAPRLEVTYSFCESECSGWRLSEWGKPSEWAAPMLQFILPAVIFSMTIPRRRKLEAPDWLFDFEVKNWTNIARLVLSLLGAGFIVAADTLVWVFVIFAGAGPMLVGGIHEAILDRRIVVQLNQPDRDPQTNALLELSAADKTEMLLAVVSGNLDSNVGNAEGDLRRVIGLNVPGQAGQPPVPKSLEEKSRSLTSLLSMMASQYSFGGTVGAPVLFYIGAFVYGVTGLKTNMGDNDTAHSLAFGMWWMVIVHVSIVSGCLLASNNPNTAVAVVSREIALSTGHPVRGATAPKYDWLRHYFTTPIYETKYQPVPLWDRGCMKKCWVEHTQVWKNPSNDWFKRKIKIGIQGYCGIALASFVLIIIPAALGFIVSYFTPKVCLSCRSLTFTVYTGCQLVLIIVATWRSYFYRDSGSDIDDILNEFRESFLRIKGSTLSFRSIAGTSWFLITVLVTFGAIGVSVFSGFAGTLMQVIGVFRNCKCYIPVSSWGDPGQELINLASDTQEMRDSTKYWNGTGYAAIGFLSIICYVGWWYQRYLRRRFEERVIELAR